jgi:hypothetical protein
MMDALTAPVKSDKLENKQPTIDIRELAASADNE